MTLLWSRGQPRWIATFRVLAAVAMALAAFLIVRGVVLAAGDPAGDATLEADPAAGVNFVWTLTSGALVFFMQAGFALLGAGLIRAKNTVNYLTKNILGLRGRRPVVLGLRLRVHVRRLGSAWHDRGKCLHRLFRVLPGSRRV